MSPMEPIELPPHPILERVRTVLTAAPTYLIAAAFVVRAILEEVAQAVDVVPPWLAGGAAALLTGLALAVSIIKRVTPVLPSARELLPPAAGQPVTAREAELLAELERVRTEFP